LPENIIFVKFDNFANNTLQMVRSVVQYSQGTDDLKIANGKIPESS
jgi:hypothetical protein